MYKGSNLDKIFKFKFENIDINQMGVYKYFFIENDSFYINNGILQFLKINNRFLDRDLNSVILKDYKNHLEHRKLFNSPLPNEDIKIRGHFYDYSLMPSLDVFNKYLEIRHDVIDKIKIKYKDIESEKSVAVHFRGTDHKGFMNHIFPKGLQVDEEYYKAAIELIEKNLGQNITYHLFSDDIEYLINIFRDKKIIIHADEPHLDWVAIFLMKNVIQTNSSFCWTASLFNKIISIQPNDGYNYHQQSGSIPFGFHQKNSILVKKLVK